MSSSDESDSPEVITLKAAKSQSKSQDKELEERRKRSVNDFCDKSILMPTLLILKSIAHLKKEKNQARDVRLKAENAKKKGLQSTRTELTGERTRKRDKRLRESRLDIDEVRARLEERMQRAMATAEEEGESGDPDDGPDFFMDEGEGNSTATEENEGGDSQVAGTGGSSNPDYLP